MNPVVVLQLLILLMLANGTPVIAKKMVGGYYPYPLDGNLTFADGRPVSRSRRCKVISGGQLRRTGRMQEPTPTEVYPTMPQ